MRKFTMDSQPGSFEFFLVENAEYVHRIRKDMHDALKGSYIPVKSMYTTEETDRYIKFHQCSVRDKEIQNLRYQIETLENVREVQSRLIDKLSK